MRSEESGGRAESLLATALSRPRWAAAHLAVAAGGSVLILAALGAGAGIADAVAGDDAGRLPLLLGSAVALAPAVWVLAGAALALVGLAPRAALAAWGLIAACFLLLYVGPLLSVPQWVMDISPFTHVPLLPAAELDVLPLVVLTAIAVALAAVGVAALRRRDVPAV
jgi:ABC-2 type transport system permease protein